jgi:hypothetical protein
MWIILTLVLGGVLVFYWLAFWGTVLAWMWCILDLCQGKFIRATIWFCTGLGMLAWWMADKDVTFNGWMQFSAVVIGLTILVVFIRWIYVRQRTVQNVPPFGTMPKPTGNIIPFIKATRDERERVMLIQGHHCANPYCNMDLRQSVPHWDHIVPRSQGGTDSVHNMQWLCDTCNLNKKDMNWLEFLFRYATGIGMDPNVNQEPWKKWVLTRASNGLQCQG